MPGFQFFSLNPCQVHLIGNVAVWYAGTASLVAYGALLTVYLLRRRRQCYDIPEGKRGTYSSGVWSEIYRDRLKSFLGCVTHLWVQGASHAT